MNSYETIWDQGLAAKYTIYLYLIVVTRYFGKLNKS